MPPRRAGRLAPRMNRSFTALFAALEALLVVGIGIGIPLVPLTILWAFQYDLGVDWIVFWRAAVDIWLLGAGTDVTMTLQPALADALGFAGAGQPFILTIAPLGFALLTALLGARAGRRISETPHRFVGLAVAVGTFAVLSLAVTLSALLPAARASIWQGTLLPTLCFTVGIVIGAEWSHPSLDALLPARADRVIRAWVGRWRPELRASLAAAFRGGTATAAIVLGASALLLAILILAGYAKIITLYEGVHAGILGGVALTVGQLAFLPNLIIWTASWIVGPGFAIGAGSSVSPFGTSLGPIPAVPVLGALPAQHELGWGFLALLIPVVTGFLIALVVRGRLVAALPTVGRVPWLVLAGVLSGVVGGIILGLLAWASAGAAGPGRLMDVGPSPWLVGAFAALEIAVSATVGLLAGRQRASAVSPSR